MFGVAAFVAVAFASCTSGTSSNESSRAPAALPPTPLATSLVTPQGTWATIPMGHLNDPLNTFWQLFFQPAGSQTWTNHVEAAAVATNGGLALASASSGGVLVGVLASNLLRYSPLIYSSDAGQSWSNGVLAQALSSRTDSLALSAAGRALALVSSGSGDSVMQSSGGFDSWTQLTGTKELDESDAGRSCGVGNLSAVSYIGDVPVVGSSCRGGSVGVFIDGTGSWQLAGPTLSPTAGADASEVLALRPIGSGLGALVGVSARRGSEIFAAWTSDGTHWTVSNPLPIGSGERLASFGPANGSAFFALLDTGDRSVRLLVVGPGTPWQPVASPPGSTRTVAFTPGAVEAMVVDQNKLTVWALGQGDEWSKVQVANVAIQYGSSG